MCKRISHLKKTAGYLLLDAGAAAGAADAGVLAAVDGGAEADGVVVRTRRLKRARHPRRFTGHLRRNRRAARTAHRHLPYIAYITSHHHQPINVPTAGAQAFLMDYT
jgi:hypothetical protein